MGGVGEARWESGAITDDVLKFRKIIEFQSSWIVITVHELCTCLIIDEIRLLANLVKKVKIRNIQL